MQKGFLTSMVYESTSIPKRTRDIKGKKFGLLTVVEYAGSIHDKSGKIRHYWKCECECGNVIESRMDWIESSRAGLKSCGCSKLPPSLWANGGNHIDIIGNRYGRLLVIDREENDHRGKSRWRCQCDCGNMVVVVSYSLRSGATRSCGCLSVQTAAMTGKERATHGMSRSLIYKIWGSMKSRCENARDRAYIHYGARGISVCERWSNSFEYFYEDVGDPPSGKYSLDRIDNNGNYEPGNVRWANATQQARNRRSNFVIAFNGKTMTATDWGEHLGIRPQTITQRIRRDGWSVEDALTKVTTRH